MSVADTTEQVRAPGATGVSAATVAAWIVVALLVVYPHVATDFFTFQIGAYSLILGIIALSLMLLAGYGGMVSLAQMSVAGIASYAVAIFGVTSGVGLGWPWFVVVPIAIIAGMLFSIATGLLAIRTEGIYTIMITLAIGMALYLFALQNYAIFNGHRGYAGIAPPVLFGIDWRAPKPFYYLSLAVAAACYLGVLYLSRATFGLALQAVRDNPRRMEAIGFDVKAHRIASYALAGAIAAVGGILLVWFNGRVSPGTIGVDRIIDILVIAVIGGLSHPIGPFLGAVFYVLLDNFAIDLLARERFNTVIGVCFLAIVLFSPDGLLGLWGKVRPYLWQTGGKAQ